MSTSNPDRRIVRLVKKDSTGRIALGKWAAHKYYHVDVREDGVIVMKPVIPDE